MPLPDPSPATTVVVTGASSGIGAELARVLARRGHHVTLVARRRERLEALALALGEAEPIVCDLTDAAARARLIAELAALGRAVVGLCNNAGHGSSGEFVRLPLDRKVGEVRLNVEALHELTGALLPRMVARREGAILNVASIAGAQPMPGFATYAATKAFVIAFSEALHAELRGSGVSCTVLCPGPTRTEFSRLAGVGDIERAAWRVFGTPTGVARAGVRGMVEGRRVVYPRGFDRALAGAGHLAPRAMVLPLVRSFTIGARRRPR